MHEFHSEWKERMTWWLEEVKKITRENRVLKMMRWRGSLTENLLTPLPVDATPKRFFLISLFSGSVNVPNLRVEK